MTAANNVVEIEFNPEYYKTIKNAVVKLGYETVFKKICEHTTQHLARVIIRKALKSGWGS